MTHSSLGLFGLYRMSVRTAVPLDEQGNTVLISSRAAPTSMELYPDTKEYLED